MEYNVTYRQKDKGWQFIISYKDNNGNWKQRSKQGFKNKKDAKPIAEKMIIELKTKSNLNNELDGITFEDFKDMYINHINLHMEANTIKLYNAALKHFKTLNEMPMEKIKSIHIQNCIDEMIKKNLSYGTIKTYKNRITAIFNSAVDKYNIIDKSPATNLEIRKDKTPTNKKALTETELKKLIDKTKNMKYKAIFSLAGMCGLRIGEILGLKWSKIDFKNNLITVDLQWKIIKSDGTVGLGELKTKNSYRTIPMPPLVKEILLKWYNSNPIDISNRVIVYNCVAGLTNLLRNYTKKLGFDLSIHEFRHTYATSLIARGIDFKTVAKLMGHDVEQTMKTYSHVTDEMFNNATKVINEIF